MANPHETKKAPRSLDPLKMTKEGFSPAIESLLTNPLDNKDRGLIDASSLIRISLTLPSGAPELREGLHVVSEALKDQAMSPVSTFAALLLGDIIVYQPSLPTEKRARAIVKEDPESLGKFILSLGQYHRDEGTVAETNTLAQRLQEVQERIDSMLDHAPADNEEMEQQLRLVDALSQLKLGNSIPSSLFEELGSPAMKRWIEEVKERVADLAAEPLASELLLQGKIEDMHPGLRAIIWYSPLNNKILIDEADRDDPRYQKLAEYFLSHPELQKPFWHSFSSDLLPIPEYATRILGVAKLPNGHPITEWFFLQEPDMITGFLTTIPLGQYSPQQMEALIRKLLGVGLIARRPEGPAAN